MYCEINGMINEACATSWPGSWLQTPSPNHQVLTAVCHHLLAIDHSNVHTDGLILCHMVGWDLKRSASVCLRCMGAGDRSPLPNLYHYGACYCKIWQYVSKLYSLIDSSVYTCGNFELEIINRNLFQFSLFDHFEVFFEGRLAFC